MISIWEKQSFLQADTIIVGGGILGLSTACSIKERQPNKPVVVLERGVLPSGASTKNAGFACFGSLTELVADRETLGESLMLQLVEKRWHGLALLDQRLGTDAMDYQQLGGFELLGEKELVVHRYIDEINNLLFPLFQMEVFHSVPSKVAEFGFNADKVKDIIFNPFEGQIDTGKMMKALARKAQSLGVELLTGAEVTAIHPAGENIEIEVNDTIGTICFTARTAAICTNGFLPALLPGMNVLPGRGQVVITKPIPGLRINGAFHFDEGFYYFRNYNDRVLFGGGRNLDSASETTTRFSPNERIVNDLKEKLSTIILPGTPFEIDGVWQGIMGFGPTKFPTIELPYPNVFAALGCNGMGVALSSLLGEELAERMIA